MSPDLLRKLSEADLQALAAGDMSRVSSSGLQLISGRQPEPEKPIDPTEGMSGTQKVLANIGGGMMDLATGVRQFYTDMTGTDAEKAAMRAEVEDKRKRDAALAEATPGGKWAGKGLQVAGNVVPTLALPVGAALRTLTALPRAMGLMRAAPATARLGTATLATDAALTGGVLGAVEPVGQDESRGVNVLKGAALSGATPAVLAGGNQIMRQVTQRGGEARAGEQITRQLAENGDQAQMLRQTLERLRQAPQSSIPLSTAATISDPQLARLEAGSRTRSGANWYDFDQNQARSVADEVIAATRGAEDVAARRGLRSNNREVLVNQAMSSVNEPAFARDLAGFRANLDTAARSAEASNPAVRGMLTQLADEIDRLGPDFRPENLATIRANLASKTPRAGAGARCCSPTSATATSCAPRRRPARSASRSSTRPRAACAGCRLTRRATSPRSPRQASGGRWIRREGLAGSWCWIPQPMRAWRPSWPPCGSRTSCRVSSAQPRRAAAPTRPATRWRRARLGMQPTRWATSWGPLKASPAR